MNMSNLVWYISMVVGCRLMWVLKAVAVIIGIYVLELRNVW